MGALNNVGAVMDSYGRKCGYRRQDAAKEKSEGKFPPQEQEESGVIVSLALNEQQSAFGSYQDEENLSEQMLQKLESASDLDTEAILISAKRQILNMLIKSARVLLSVRYTPKSWKGLVEALKQAMPLAGSDKAVTLDKAISIMRGGLGGLEPADPGGDDDGVREQLPFDQSFAGGASETAQPTAAEATATAGAATSVVNISV